MKKGIFITLMTLFAVTCYTQDTAIQYISTNTNWIDILTKAKTEHKYIFMDCYATWCKPCIWMDANILNKPEVVLYFNKNFLNVRVQVNKTNKDSPNVINWYEDARRIQQEYGIMAFPTYMFFSPEGNVVHRFTAAVESPQKFIQYASQALDTSQQNYRHISRYKEFSHDSLYLRSAISEAINAWDVATAAKICEYYIKTLKDPYSKSNLDIIVQATNSTQSTGFHMFINNPSRVNSNLGNKTFATRAYSIVFQEEVGPFLGKNSSVPDWKKITKSARKKFPEKAEMIVAQGKVLYFRSINHIAEFEISLKSFMDVYINELTDYEINKNAWDIFLLSSQKTAIDKAIHWMDYLLSNEKHYGFNGSFGDNYAAYLDTYANLLYKIGRCADAIKWEQKALQAATDIKDNDFKKSAEETIIKMQSGVKTWEVKATN